MSYKSFSSNKKFFDDKNYPNGISRSGNYTIKESKILEQFGVAFTELESGVRAPETKEEAKFVQVVKTKEEATTMEEKTWLKYKDLINRDYRHYTLTDHRESIVDNDDY